MSPLLQSMNAFEANLIKTSFLQNSKQSYALQWKVLATVLAGQLLVISAFYKLTYMSTFIERYSTLVNTGIPQGYHLVFLFLWCNFTPRISLSWSPRKHYGPLEVSSSTGYKGHRISRAKFNYLYVISLFGLGFREVFWDICLVLRKYSLIQLTISQVFPGNYYMYFLKTFFNTMQTTMQNTSLKSY